MTLLKIYWQTLYVRSPLPPLDECVNGVYDPRMGPVEIKANTTCITCNLPSIKCPGHFGHICLVIPVINPVAAKKKLLVPILRKLCYKCNRVLISQEMIDLECEKARKGGTTKQSVNTLFDMNLPCPHCNSTIQPKYTRLDTTFSQTLKISGKEIKTILQVKDVLQIFKNIKKEDLKILGCSTINHPKDMIITVQKVLPPMDRPYIKMQSQTCDDDLSTFYRDIVSLNNKIKDGN